MKGQFSGIAARAIERDVRECLARWRAMLTKHVQDGRQLLREVLEGPLRFTPEARTYRFDGFVAGPTFRRSLPIEKEVGLYVAYDADRQKFVSPTDAVDEVEAIHRAMTLMYLGLTARALLRALETRSDRSWYRLFGPLALRICSEPLFQEQMPQVFTDFESISDQHRDLLITLREHIDEARRELEELVEGGNRLAASRAAPRADAASPSETGNPRDGGSKERS